MSAQEIALADARRLIARAIDKAEDLGVRGAVTVVGASGVLVSGSRMDHGGSTAMARAHSKAWIAATQQMPSLVHLDRMRTLPPPMATGFVACAPEAIFPGAGGMPLYADEVVIGGVAASGATVGPFVTYPGAVREKLIAGGKPANNEDLLVHYALGLPYAGQHGDDEARWIAAYGSLPTEEGLGLADPPAAAQPGWRAALALADRVMAAAAERGLRVAVAVVDRRGDPIQQDTMDGAPTAAPYVAAAVAAAAATFQVESQDVPDGVAHTLPFTIATLPGGVPLADGAVGVAGAAPDVCRELAGA